jgi:hypothetical protein
MGCGPLSFICDAVGGVAGKAADAGFDVIAKSFADAAKTLCEWMWSAISTTTTVDLTGEWFKSDIGLTAALAGVMVAALFVMQLIKGALRRDPHALGRALTGAGMAFLGAAAAIIVTESLLALTDALSNGVVHLAGQKDLASMGKLLTPVDVLTSSGFTPALVIALSVFFVIGSVLVWAVFIIRKALIIVAAVFAPIAFGGAPADATRGWVRRWVEFTLAMVFSKLVVVLIFTIALSLLAHSGGDWTGLSNLMTGLLLLILASFSPWMVFKLVHFVAGDLAAAHHMSAVSDTRAATGSAMAVAGRAKGSAQNVFASGAAPAAARSAAAPSPVGVAVAAGAAASRTATTPGRTASTMTDNAPRSTPRHAAAEPRPLSRTQPPTRLSNNGVDWSEAT